MRLSDQEIHEQAQAYALRNGVSYTEALLAVVTLGAVQYAEPVWKERAGSGLSDAEIDRRAKGLSQLHQVSYAEALGMVCSTTACFRGGDIAVSFSEAAGVLEGQWLDVFRSGVHIDDSGVQHAFSMQDVQDIATGYRPEVREAPIVIGHPVTDGPAHGWVRELRVAPGGVLQMRPAQVSPEFAEMIRAGRFKKRSAALYLPDHPSNPNPGKCYLRHVGFLGAAQPALSGLRDPVFQ